MLMIKCVDQLFFAWLQLFYDVCVTNYTNLVLKTFDVSSSILCN